MDSTLNPFSLASHTLILLASFGLFLQSVNTSTSDYSSLVYNKCANQTYTGSTESHSQTLSSLFQQLLAESSRSKFFKTTLGDEEVGISALFQCRGDLRNEECYNCINRLPKISNTLCKQAVSARVQLNGCYFQYETDGFSDETPTHHELLHETCSEKKAVASGFEEVRDAGFAAMESGVVSGNGFYQMDYEYLHVVAQCEGGLGGCDCGECVSIAVEIAQEKCGSSISGQVYLDQCSLTYGYNPGGIKGNSYPEEGRNRYNTGKAVAIVLGGAAALGVAFIVLRLIKSWGKKDDT